MDIKTMSALELAVLEDLYGSAEVDHILSSEYYTQKFNEWCNQMEEYAKTNDL